MKVKYVGLSSSVQIAATGQVVKRGETVEVKPEVGRELAKQSTWKKVEAKKAPNKEKESSET